MPVARKQPKREKPNPARRFVKPVRPHKWGPDRLPMPSALEIAEGKAHKIWVLHPQDKEAETAWLQAHEALWCKEGAPATTRCPRCHVLRWGRRHTDPCGHCGLVRDRSEEE